MMDAGPEADGGGGPIRQDVVLQNRWELSQFSEPRGGRFYFLLPWVGPSTFIFSEIKIGVLHTFSRLHVRKLVIGCMDVKFDEEFKNLITGSFISFSFLRYEQLSSLVILIDRASIHSRALVDAFPGFGRRKTKSPCVRTP